ncbi:hypothetical protein GCM10010435_66370 [Winogradskya consettensis]|uniref:Uncharacterized protein n=1 Tax=Winogradskya consettensis TaxID=113560 RepID=A0A919T3C5_9ACTN|nr:hypothetical protein Aco04nite_90750 [Actinoplanes consettensis]
MYDTAVRSGGARMNDETIQLTASSASSSHPNRIQAGRCLGAGVPGAPPGWPSTFQGGGGEGSFGDVMTRD